MIIYKYVGGPLHRHPIVLQARQHLVPALELLERVMQREAPLSTLDQHAARRKQVLDEADLKWAEDTFEARHSKKAIAMVAFDFFKPPLTVKPRVDRKHHQVPMSERLHVSIAPSGELVWPHSSPVAS